MLHRTGILIMLLVVAGLPRLGGLRPVQADSPGDPKPLAIAALAGAEAGESNGWITDWLPVKSRPVECRYQLDIEVKAPGQSPDEAPRAAVRQRLWYRNTTGKPQRELPMVGPRPETIRDDAGKILRTSAPDTKDRWLVSLDSPLPPGGHVEFAAEFEVRVGPSKHGAKGYRELSGVWHPKVLDLSASGGTEGPNAAIASYNATVTVPEGWKCVTSGLKSAPRNGRAENALRSTADHIADFAVVLTRELVPIQREAAGVRIELLHRPERARQAEQMADLAVDVVKFYSDRFGFYPQPYLCVVMLGRGFGGGPIGGNTVRVCDSIDRSLSATAWGVAHEIGHEYWGFECVVDSDHLARWFGLGMGLHSDKAYCEAKGWEVAQHRNYMRDFVSMTRRGVDHVLLPDPPRPVHKDVAHWKGFLGVELLHSQLGEERFARAMKQFLTEHRYRRVSQDVIRSVFQNHAPHDLAAFFDAWLKSSKTPDCRIRRVSASERAGKHQIDVELEAVGGLRVPLSVELVLDDGKKLRKQRPLTGPDTVRFVADTDWYLALVGTDMYKWGFDHALNPSSVNLTVEEIRFDPVGRGKNQVAVKARNLSDRPQVLAVGIQAHSPGGYWQDWGTTFFATLGPHEGKWCPFAFKFHQDVSEEASVELSFYNPPSIDTLHFEAFFKQETHLGPQLKRRPESPPMKPAPPRLRETILARFKSIKGLRIQQEYEQAWDEFTTGCHQVRWFDKFVYFEEGPPGDKADFSWMGRKLSELELGSVKITGGKAILSVSSQDSAWTIEFVMEQGEWKIDWFERSKPTSNKSRADWD